MMGMFLPSGERLDRSPASYSGGPGFKSRPRKTAILAEVFRGFLSLIPPLEIPK
jgi:hypothetical protein